MTVAEFFTIASNAIRAHAATHHNVWFNLSTLNYRYKGHVIRSIVRLNYGYHIKAGNTDYWDVRADDTVTPP